MPSDCAGSANLPPHLHRAESSSRHVSARKPLPTGSNVTHAATRAKQDPPVLTSPHEHARTAASTAYHQVMSSRLDDEPAISSALAPISNSSPKSLVRAKSSPHQLGKGTGRRSEGSHLARQRSSAGMRATDRSRGRKTEGVAKLSKHRSTDAPTAGPSTLLRRSRSTISSGNGFGRVNTQARSFCGEFKSVASGGSIGRDDSDVDQPVVYRASPVRRFDSRGVEVKRSASIIGLPGAKRKGITSTELRGMENSKLPDLDTETKHDGGGEKLTASVRRRATTASARAEGSPPRVVRYGGREEESSLMLRRSEPQDENARVSVEAARDKYLRAYQEGSMAKLYEMISASKSNSPERSNDKADGRMRSLNVVDEIPFRDPEYSSAGAAEAPRAQYPRELQRLDQSHDQDDGGIREGVERLAEETQLQDERQNPQRGSLRLKVKKMSGSLRRMYGRSSGAPSIPPRSSSVVPVSPHPVFSVSSAYPPTTSAAPDAPSARSAPDAARRSTTGNVAVLVSEMGSLEFPAQQMRARREHWFGGRSKTDRHEGSETSTGGSLKRRMSRLGGRNHTQKGGPSEQGVDSSLQGAPEPTYSHAESDEGNPPMPPVHRYLLPRDREHDERPTAGSHGTSGGARLASRETQEEHQSRITSWADSSTRDGTNTAFSTRTDDPNGSTDASQRSNAAHHPKGTGAITANTNHGHTQHPAQPPQKPGLAKRVRSVSLFSSSGAASSAGKSEGSVGQKGNKLQGKRSLLLLGRGGAGSRLSNARDEGEKGEKSMGSAGSNVDSKGVFEALLKRIGGKKNRKRDGWDEGDVDGDVDGLSSRAATETGQDHETVQRLERALQREETPTPPIPPKSTLRFVREEDQVTTADDEYQESETVQFDRRRVAPRLDAPAGFGVVSPSIYSERPAPGPDSGYRFGRSMSTLQLPEGCHSREGQQMRPGMATITMSKSVSTFNLRGQERSQEASVVEREQDEEPQQRSMSEEWRDWARERTMGFSDTDNGELRELKIDDNATAAGHGHGVRRHKREGAAVDDEGLGVLTRTATLMNDRFPMVTSRKGSKASLRSTTSNSRQTSREKPTVSAGRTRTNSTLERAVSASVVASPAAAARAGVLRSASSGMALRPDMAILNPDKQRSLRSVASAATGLRGTVTSDDWNGTGATGAEISSDTKGIADRIISRLPSRDHSEKASNDKDTTTSDGRNTPRKNAVVLKKPSFPRDRDGNDPAEGMMSSAMRDIKRQIRQDDEGKAASSSTGPTPASRPATARTPENERPSRIPSPKRATQRGVSPVPKGGSTGLGVLQKRSSPALVGNGKNGDGGNTKALRERIEKGNLVGQGSAVYGGSNGTSMRAVQCENSRPRAGGAVMDEKFLGGIRQGPYAFENEGNDESDGPVEDTTGRRKRYGLLTPGPLVVRGSPVGSPVREMEVSYGGGGVGGLGERDESGYAGGGGAFI